MIVSTVLAAAICTSVVAVVLALQPRAVGGPAPRIDRPESATAPPRTTTISLDDTPSTMAPHIPRLGSSTPAGIINLTNWKLTLPTGDDDAAEIKQPKLMQFRDPRYFHVDPIGAGVVFRAPVGGATTGNSEYPRSELREMTAGGKKEASWSGESGTHVMTISQAITAVPQGKPQVVAGQIHDAEDDVIMVRLNGSKLFVESDGRQVGVLDPAYRLGTRFTVQIVATPGRIRVTYNGIKTVGMERDGGDYYFKAGCYTQANDDNSDEGSYGEVVIHALTVQHS
ncbi:MAG TPA: polysaccharide lyase family 7 protein [Aeromicrobium sp.]|nr:polysaccharide lyase family 7 protein [Aeromicrobium sp.]